MGQGEMMRSENRLLCPSSIFSTFFKLFSIVLITNYIQLLQPLRRDEEGFFPSLLIALNTLFRHENERGSLLTIKHHFDMARSVSPKF